MERDCRGWRKINSFFVTMNINSFLYFLFCEYFSNIWLKLLVLFAYLFNNCHLDLPNLTIFYISGFDYIISYTCNRDSALITLLKKIVHLLMISWCRFLSLFFLIPVFFFFFLVVFFSIRRLRSCKSAPRSHNDCQNVTSNCRDKFRLRSCCTVNLQVDVLVINRP